MWLALQLSHNDVLGVGLSWVLGLGGPESLPIARSFSTVRPPSTTTTNAIDDARRRPIDDGSELSAENYYVAYVEAETQI